MVIPEKVRAMSDVEKLHYFFERMVGEESDLIREDLLAEINKLLKGCPLDQVAERFNVKTEFDFKSTPATMTITLPEGKGAVTFDLTVPDRDQFFDAHPEAKARPTQSFLNEDEQKEVKDLVGEK